METTTTLSSNLHSFYQKVLLKSAEKELRYKQLGMEKVHPKGTGKDYFLLRYGNIASSTSTLTEGVTPSATTVDTNKYTVSINEYGQYIQVTQLLDYTAIDGPMKTISEKMGYAAAKSIDEVIRDTLIANATTNLQYVGSGNSADNDIAANETYTAPDFIKPVRILRANDAPAYEDGLYVGVVHPNIALDIMSDTSAGGFIELNKYVAGLAEGALKGEVGKIYGVRLVQSSNVTSATNGSSVAVYRSMVFARESFVMTKFNTDAVEIITKSADSGGPSNPLNLLGTVGYKMQFGIKYLGGTFTGDNGASPDLVIQLRGAATSS